MASGSPARKNVSIPLDGRPNFPLLLALALMLLAPVGLICLMKIAPGSRSNLGVLHLLYCATLSCAMPILALFTRKPVFILKAAVLTGLSALFFLLSMRFLLNPLANVLSGLLWEGRVSDPFNGILLYYLGMSVCGLLCFIALLPIGAYRGAGLAPGVLFVIALLPAAASFPLSVAADALRVIKEFP